VLLRSCVLFQVIPTILTVQCSADAERAAASAEASAKQLAERSRLQEALKCEKKRLAELRLRGAVSDQEEDAYHLTDAERGGEVQFSRVGRGKLVHIEG